MTTYTIHVEFPNGSNQSLTTTDRYLADLAYKGLNVMLPLGHEIVLEMLNSTECLAVRNKWEDRRPHWGETVTSKGPNP